CKVIGHHMENCKKWSKKEEVKENQDNNTKKKLPSDPRPVFVQVKDGKAQQGKTNEVINVEKEVINVEDISGKEQQSNLKEKENESIDKANMTTDITPEQLNETQKTDEIVLNPKALFQAQDQLLEKELNKHIEPDPNIASVSSSQGSFVKDTQVQVEPIGSSSPSDSLRVTPDRVIKDINFLNQSWANMIEAEEEAQEETEKRDFNVILGANEHRGRFSPARTPMNEFQSWTDSFNLIHLPTRGAEFTWNNGRGALIKHKSDHFPLLLEARLTSSSFVSHFKFMKMWTLHPDCKNIVAECWNTVVVGCPMFILSKKLKILKDKLKNWNRECFGNVHTLVISAEQKLQNIQDQIQYSGHTDDLLKEERVASTLYEEALNRQEAFWQEKARVKWHLEGDRNTKYFHRLAKIKTSTKLITTLQDGDNVLIDPNQIAEHVVKYYKNLFGTNTVLQDSLLTEEVIPKLVNDEVNALMTVLPSHDEIKAAVFALNKDSAPGPDGFGASFFQHYWDIVKNDVFSAVLEFFTSSWILPGFNSNIIALLPKTPDASSIDQYRPIAMANFKFKVITKIIADRLASIMPSIVSEEQRGFIHDRNIKECLCIASEAANLLHNKSFGGNLALKIDITKAFDTLEWSFLLKVLNSFGFNEVFCNWIHVILRSAFLSISINGKSHGYFNCTRGVRQGDPLSPLLFCLAEDVLSRQISKIVAEGKLNLIKGTRHVLVPSHSFYADDLMIFCKGNMAGLRELKSLFTRYAFESGQDHYLSTIWVFQFLKVSLVSVIFNQ
ncbi:ribonuclease H, partial [Trifolium pratense]